MRDLLFSASLSGPRTFAYHFDAWPRPHGATWTS